MKDYNSKKSYTVNAINWDTETRSETILYKNIEAGRILEMWLVANEGKTPPVNYYIQCLKKAENIISETIIEALLNDNDDENQNSEKIEVIVALRRLSECLKSIMNEDKQGGKI